MPEKESRPAQLSPWAKRRKRWAMVWDQARADTNKLSDDAWRDLLMALSAAVIGSTTVATALNPGQWWKSFSAGLTAGVVTLSLFFLLLFSINLVRAPRRLREGMANPPGSYAILRGKATIRPHDVMQGEAGIIAGKIQDYQEFLKRHRPGSRSPDPLKGIHDQIELFERRARTDEWITGKSRKRSLKLWAEISKLEDLDEIKKRCIAFAMLRPSK